MSAVASPEDDRRRASSRPRLVGKRITDLATHSDAWVEPEQVADYYGVSLKTVMLKWIGTGILPAQRFPGKHVRINVRELIAFEQKHLIEPKKT